MNSVTGAIGELAELATDSYFKEREPGSVPESEYAAMLAHVREAIERVVLLWRPPGPSTTPTMTQFEHEWAAPATELPARRVRRVPASEYDALIDIVKCLASDPVLDPDDYVDRVRADLGDDAATWLDRILTGNETAQTLFKA